MSMPASVLAAEHRSPRRPFTGRHMAAIMIAFFGVVIAVNVLMASLASRTFGGVVVENSYVASQHFNRWLDEAGAERRLGWRAAIHRAADGRIEVTLTGAPERAVVTGEAWHPLGQAPDHLLRFRPQGATYRSTRPVPAGRWRIRIEVRAGAQRWRSEQTVS